MDKMDRNIFKEALRMCIYIYCLIFLLGGLLLVPVEAAKQNPDTGESCQGVDCEGFDNSSSSGSGSSGSSDSTGSSNSSGSSSTITGLDEVIDCNDTQSKDMRAVAWNIADDWTNFDNQVEAATGFNLGSCTKNRFSENGKVQCMANNKCKNNGSCRNGWASPFNKKIKIYPTFLNKIASLPQPDRRACYAALMTHEFAHSCDRMESGAEAREDAGFNYWKGRFAVTSTLDMQTHCGLD